ncbi:hypothetical protein HU200_009635 [Digitaria exilis]|uniref:RNase H type-1 domain-containing protein n=1 Tax=Digitaria exilis TaxID=1010633 RepID=A0A835KMX7_9POAL|nr:hypothetical protein HU200_009635 [Digitaria exilis]
MYSRPTIGLEGEPPCSSSDNRVGRDKGKRSKPASRWRPPPEGWTKVNVDGSFVIQTGGAGIGVVGRDNRGNVKFLACQEILSCASAAEAEASAVLMGVRLATQWSPGKVLLETDCARVAHALQAGKDRSELGFIFREICEQASMLEEWKIVQVKRESNLVADELAQLARRSKLCKVWLEGSPACVTHLLRT